MNDCPDCTKHKAAVEKLIPLAYLNIPCPMFINPETDCPHGRDDVCTNLNDIDEHCLECARKWAYQSEKEV